MTTPLAATVPNPTPAERNAELMRELERRMVAHLAAGGTTDMAPSPMRNPGRAYTDPLRLEAEKRELFHKLPLLAGFSRDIEKPGDVMLFDAAGPAIMIVRTRSGEAKAFLNMCTHRGAKLVRECSRRNLITCPFHAWSFDLEGRLVAMPGDASFEGVDRTTRGLIPVPVGEWRGLIFVKAHPGEEVIDVERWLGDLAPIMEGLELDKAGPVKLSQVEVDCNWKFALDTYGEGYHFSALHPATFGTETCSNTILYQQFGLHYRVNFVHKSYLDLVDKDERDWPATPYGGSHLLFPNTILYSAPMEGGGRMIGLYRLFPGEGPGSSVTLMSTYRAADAPESTPDEAFAQAHDYIEQVVRTEDYSVSKDGQRNLEHAPEGFELIYGRNEAAIQNNHRNIARLIGLPVE
ncbi:aromatic ring-hydroxylating oxygenase subunit alpha [Phenylobacterium montanum]|uniref:Rieske 2Fe-2S domain-containing protein n=1 Tax=Phenylobacterium montanum TaxID=2823693 RepID=A0A975G4F6_9CAUL|nr:SRPBCC family protein [Caulobacter sp. S6]QUD90397.1 Rieske 2Fe-2S domain-containing protein [Caulobacter sp. S6]